MQDFLDTRGHHARTVLAHLALCFLAAWYICQAIPNFVYPEYSIFATAVYGFRGGPDFQALLQGYNPFHGGGWYRPTTVFLIPYLMPSDLYHPRTIFAVNSAFFALTAFLGPALFLARFPLRIRVFSSLMLLGAPALTDSYLFPCPDAPHILFSVLFLYCLYRAYVRERVGGVALWLAVPVFLLAITSKEITVMAAFLAPLLLYMSRRPVRWRRLVLLTTPFMLMAGLFYLFMLTRLDLNDPSYSNVPTLERLSHILHLTAFASNLRWPQTGTYPGWATSGYSTVGSLAWALLWAGTAWALSGARHLWDWKQAAAAATLVLMPLVAFALLGGQPHHAFAVLAILAILVPWLWEHWMRGLSRPWPALVLLGCICVGLVFGQAGTVSNLLTTWRQADNYRHITRLYQDEAFHALAQREDVYFLVEECPDRWSTGCFIGVRPYLGHADWQGGEEYILKWDPTMLPDLIAKHPDKELWLLECHLQSPESYALKQLWPRP